MDDLNGERRDETRRDGSPSSFLPSFLPSFYDSEMKREGFGNLVPRVFTTATSVDEFDKEKLKKKEEADLFAMNVLSIASNYILGMHEFSFLDLFVGGSLL